MGKLPLWARLARILSYALSYLMDRIRPRTPGEFTFGEVTAMMQIPSVFEAMKRGYKIEAHKWSVPDVSCHSPDGKIIYIDKDLEHWRFKGKPIDCMRFLLLKEHLAMSIIAAFRGGTPIDRAKLYLLLQMTAPAEQLADRAKAAAKLIEEYPVRLSHGRAGLRSYRRFMAAQAAKPMTGLFRPILTEG